MTGGWLRCATTPRPLGLLKFLPHTLACPICCSACARVDERVGDSVREWAGVCCCDWPPLLSSQAASERSIQQAHAGREQREVRSGESDAASPSSSASPPPPPLLLRLSLPAASTRATLQPRPLLLRHVATPFLSLAARAMTTAVAIGLDGQRRRPHPAAIGFVSLVLASFASGGAAVSIPPDMTPTAQEQTEQILQSMLDEYTPLRRRASASPGSTSAAVFAATRLATHRRRASGEWPSDGRV